MQPITLNNHSIEANGKPFIVAELSGNHNQSFERAIELIDQAVKSGVDAVKLQTYTADTMTMDSKRKEFYIGDQEKLWQGNSLHQLYQKAYTPWEWQADLYAYCREKNIICFSSPFDNTAVDFLEKLGNPIYKIASFECTDSLLLKKVAQTGKPMIISTGMANLAEIAQTVETIQQHGCKQYILLKCTSNYPADPASSNLKTLENMQTLFQCPVGFSDHTLGCGAAIAAVALGAAVIEKHFTLKRSDGGVDAAFSMEPEEMRQLVLGAEQACQAIGKVHYGTLPIEQSCKNYRRSLYIAKEMKQGDIFTEQHMRSIRPGYGLPTQYYDVFLGKKINQNVEKGTPLSWELIG